MADAKWRGKKTDPTRRKSGSGRGRQLFVATAVLLAIVAAVLAIVLYIDKTSRSAFLTIPVREYGSRLFATNAFAVQDSQLLAPHFVSNTSAYESQSRDKFDDLLRGLGTRKSGPVVIHVCALSRVGDDGEVQLLPGDAQPLDPTRWVGLKEVLKNIRDCPATQKILLLDVTRPIADVRLGILADDVSDAVERVLAAEMLPFYVLTACSKGQRSHVSEELGSSVFAYYLDQGLRARADGWGHANGPDQRVFVSELADYVTKHVDRWVWMNRGLRQTPKLWGSAKDFSLVQLNLDPKSDAKEYDPSVNVTYPDWLRSAWSLRDKFEAEGAHRKTPRQFRQLEATVLRAEQRWRGGFEENRIQSELDLDVKALVQQIAKTPPAPRVVRLADIAGPKLDDANAKLGPEIRILLQKSPEPSMKLADAEKARFEETKKKLIEGLKAVPFEIGAAVLVDSARETSNLTVGKVASLNELLAEIRPVGPSERRYVESTFLDRLKDFEIRLKDFDADWPTALVYQALMSATTAERRLANFEKNPEYLLSWNRKLWDQAEEHRRKGEKILFADPPSAWKRAAPEFDQAAQFQRLIPPRIDVLEQMLAARDRAYVQLPGWAPFLVALAQPAPPELAIWQTEAQATQALVASLQRKELETLDGEPAALVQTQAQDLALQRAIDTRIARLLRIGDEGKPAEYREIHALLESPRLRTDDREKLWRTARKIGIKLHNAVAEFDDAEAAGRTASGPSLGDDATAGEERERRRRRVGGAMALLRLTPYGPIEPIQAKMDAALSTNGDPEWRMASLTLSDVWSAKLPTLYRSLVPGDLAKADLLGRIVQDPDSKTDVVTLREPRYALTLMELGDLRTLENERYLKERESLEVQGSRFATFFSEAASEFQRP